MAGLVIPGATGGSSDGIYNVYAIRMSLKDIVCKKTNIPRHVNLYFSFEDQKNKKRNVFYNGQYAVGKDGREWKHTQVIRFEDTLMKLGLSTTDVQKVGNKLISEGITDALIDYFKKQLIGNEVMVVSFLDNKNNNQQWDVVFPADTEFTLAKQALVQTFESSKKKIAKSGKNKGKPMLDPWNCNGIFDRKVETTISKDFDPLAGDVDDSEETTGDLPFSLS